MTSIEFFQEPSPVIGEVPEWGTLEEKSKKKREDLWLPKRATWTFSGVPTEQRYTLTKLKLSENRMTDQLLPRPQDVRMSDVMIRQPFPAEHCYSSHLPKFDVFPDFAKVPNDPKRGIDARQLKPKHAEMPSNSYDVNIVKKIKGNGIRHEIQQLPPESEKMPLMWHNDFFDQSVKFPDGNQQNYYPVPPKMYVPNLEVRNDSKCIRGQMVTSSHHDNATRNVERDQWQTTYDRSHTGLGPANPNKLDNYDEKQAMTSIGLDDDSLKPRAVPTFDPAWPVEGRIARRRTPNPPPHSNQYPDPIANPNYSRKLTLTEKEEGRLLNGNEYENYPADDQNTETERWKQLQKQHADTELHQLERSKSRQSQTAVPYLPAGSPQEPDISHLLAMRQEQHDQHQQVEAQNRWKELELQKPNHNLAARQHKVDLASKKGKPKVFYDHEGKYQRERSGVYQTSYDPYKLQHMMNQQDHTGGKRFDYSDYKINSLDYPTDLNDEMAEALRYSRTLGGPPGSVAQVNGRPSQHEVFEPFNKSKQRQQSEIQPNVQHSDHRTQEGSIVLRESTQGQGYNTHKFLQENTIHPHARQEPYGLMSKDNQDIKRLSTLENTMTNESLPNYGEINEDQRAMELRTQATQSIDNPLSNLPFDIKPRRLPERQLSVNTPQIHKSKGYGSLQKSKSTNFLPSELSQSWQCESSYQSQHKGEGRIDMSYKNDPRFQWKVGCGSPRPQTSLLRIQDSFKKSDVKKKFNERFNDNAPDLRENLVYGKKHSFGGMNAQILRGTPVIQC